MKALSLFSGAGGMDAGFARAGIHSAIACEADKAAADTWQANFSGDIHRGDVRNLIPLLAPGAADVVFGGPPCQGYSVAGKMDPTDERSTLVFAFADAVSKVAPEVFVMENVDALARLAKWRDVLQAIKERFRSRGFNVHVEILDASEFGVPQKRRRMFMWGSRKLGEDALREIVQQTVARFRRGPVPSSEVFLKIGRAGTDSNPHTCKAAVTFCKRPVLRASPYAGMLFNGAGRPIDPASPAPTIAASAGGNKTHIVDERLIYDGGPSFAELYRNSLDGGSSPQVGRAPEFLRRLTIKESAALQTFPDNFRFTGSISAVYRQIGNAVPCNLAEVVATAARAVALTGSEKLRQAA